MGRGGQTSLRRLCAASHAEGAMAGHSPPAKLPSPDSPRAPLPPPTEASALSAARSTAVEARTLNPKPNPIKKIPIKKT